MNPVLLIPALGSVAPLDVAAPHIEYGPLTPVFALMAGACLAVLVEAFVPRSPRRPTQIILTVATLGVAIASTLSMIAKDTRIVAGQSTLALDGPTLATWVLLLVTSLGAVVLFSERAGGTQTAFVASASSVPGSPLEAKAEQEHREHTEVYPLLMFAVLGMMCFAAADDLIMMFVALEIFSLPLYLMSGMSRRRRLLSQEAALKYFLLGALSSALFLYGIVLLYGCAGSFKLDAIAAVGVTQVGSSKLMVAGMVLVSVGLLFKVGAVPFASWTPDVYTGAPTPVSGWMAVATKLVALVGLMRVLYVGLGAMRWDWQIILAVVSVASMAVGAVVGLAQTDMKRLLAYSAIAHAGFVLVGIVGAWTIQTGMAPGQTGSVSSVLVYMTAYGLSSIGFWLLILMVRRAGGESTEIDSWAGLGRQYPWFGVLVVIFVLSFAGIPLTAGFTGKLVVFLAGWRGGYAWLVLVGVLFSLVAAAFYLRIIVVVFFGNPKEEDDPVEVADPSVAGWITLIMCAVCTVVMGVAPQPIIDLFNQASTFLR
ncbi:NADH-quinone oxidoreductase subunit NuoN [Cutibacterium equinum]|uniref:NADH-quinone oxidoreductase subunit N n=1 Tax=Cutibacterium equinum TaxID=3016342 RepID=A0ABY7QYF8_9ACTN|nr:NADH-quinone oxidoreductase subunit NuoN [Cutibacterium equinum]WCC79594.1 NADH-quinone oxidoreductase subunit NuoN [Cutibacterium equinum]